MSGASEQGSRSIPETLRAVRLVQATQHIAPAGACRDGSPGDSANEVFRGRPRNARLSLSGVQSGA